MAFARRNDQVVSVTSTNPEGVDDTSRGFADLYHYLLTCSWPSLMLQVIAAFFVLNALFGVIYYLVGGISNARKGSFADVFFFSIETMTTIGYGRLIPVTIAAHVLMSLEQVFGEIVVSLTGLDGVFMQTIYARHSYRAPEVIYGARLSDVMVRSPQGGFAIDYGKFDNYDRTEAPIWEWQIA